MPMTFADIIDLDGASAQVAALKARAQAAMRRARQTYTSTAPADLAAEAARLEGDHDRSAADLAEVRSAVAHLLDLLPDDLVRHLVDLRSRVQAAEDPDRFMPAALVPEVDPDSFIFRTRIDGPGLDPEPSRLEKFLGPFLFERLKRGRR